MAGILEDVEKHFDEARAEHKQRQLKEQADKAKKAAEEAARKAAENAAS